MEEVDTMKIAGELALAIGDELLAAAGASSGEYGVDKSPFLKFSVGDNPNGYSSVKINMIPQKELFGLEFYSFPKKFGAPPKPEILYRDLSLGELRATMRKELQSDG